MSDQTPIYLTDAQLDRITARMMEQPDDQEFYGPALRERMLNFYQGDPISARQTITVDATVRRLAPPDFARSAFVTVTANPIRVTFDGTTPAAAVGTHFGVGEHFTVSGVNSMKGFQAVQEGVAAGTIDVEYFD